MTEKKMLVYGRDGNSGKREGVVRKVKRVLAYSSLLLPLISACGGIPQHAQESVENPGGRVEQENPDCRMDGRTLVYREADGTERKRSDILQFGEHELAVACPFDEVTVLTDRSLVIVYRNGPEERNGTISVSLDSTRTDMRGILQPGFVDWAQSPDTIYVLTMDGRMTLVPKADLGETISSYPARFAVRTTDDLDYSHGLEFMAGSDGTLVIMAATPEGAARNTLTLPARVVHPDSDFFAAGGRFYYGKPDGERVEIIIEGPGANDVRIGP